MDGPLDTGFRIWLRAVILTDLIITALVTYQERSLYSLSLLLISIVLAVLTVPLLVVIVPLVKVSVRLPYTPTAQLAWLIAALCLVAFLFIMIMFYAFDKRPDFMENPGFWAVVSMPCISILLAVIWTRRSLMRLRNTLSN